MSLKNLLNIYKHVKNIALFQAEHQILINPTHAHSQTNTSSDIPYIADDTSSQHLVLSYPTLTFTRSTVS